MRPASVDVWHHCALERDGGTYGATGRLCGGAKVQYEGAKVQYEGAKVQYEGAKVQHEGARV